MVAWKHLQEATRPAGQLVANPSEFWHYKKPLAQNNQSKPNGIEQKNDTPKDEREAVRDNRDVEELDESHANKRLTSMLTSASEELNTNEDPLDYRSTSNFFCANLSK